MKNGCKKTVVYYCNVLRFDSDNCEFFQDAGCDIKICQYHDSGFCTSKEARKHADGFGKTYPPPTEPCWQRYEFPDGTRRMMEILSGSTGELFAFDMDHYPFGRPVDELDGTWGPRAPEWETDEENASMKSSAKTSS